MRPASSLLLRRCALAFAFLLTIGGSLSGLAAVDVFIKIEGVDGESGSTRFPGWSPVLSVTGLVNRTNVAAPPVLSFTITKRADKASPQILQRCGAGAVVPRVALGWFESRPNGPRFYRVVLENVVVSSFQTTAPSPGDPLPTESISFNYEKITWTCTKISPSGEPTGGVTALFDSGTGTGTESVQQVFRASLDRPPGVAGIRVAWPGERGHRYRVTSGNSPLGPWTLVREFTVPADGPAEEVLPGATPPLFLRVEEVE